MELSLYKRLFLLTLCIVILFNQDIVVRNITEVFNLRGISNEFKASYQVILQPGLFELINPSNPKYPYNVHFITENKTTCSSVANLTFLVIVLSSVGNINRRKIIRQTWANETSYSSFGSMKVLFLLGITDNVTVQNSVAEEFRIYGDLVQGDFIDTYHNLTHKSTMGFKWATERCRNAKYVIKTDDDIVINFFKLFGNTLLRQSENKTHIYCKRDANNILRNKKSKWYVEQDQFKGLIKYPTYCGGSFIMILNEVVPYMYKSAMKTPFFWIEDVFLYGIVLNNIPGIKYQTLEKGAVLYYNISAAINRLERVKKDCPTFIYFTNTLNQIVNLWTTILQVYRN